MHIRVDRDLCDSYAVCTGIVPEVFMIDADDLLVVRQEDVGEALRGPLMQAVDSCPRNALRIQE